MPASKILTTAVLLSAFQAIVVAVEPAVAENWFREPTSGVSVLGGPSGSSGSGTVMHQTNLSPNQSHQAPQGKVRRYGRRSSGASILNSVKPQDARKLTNEAVNLYVQAVAEDAKGNFNQAVLKLRKSLAIREFYWREQDKNIPVVLVKLAEVLGKQNKFDEGLQTLDKSLSYCSRIFGPGTPERIPTLTLMGALYQRKSDFPKSFESYKQAYTLTERVKGKASPESMKLRISMARVAKKSNWSRTACELYQESLDASSRGAGGLSPADLSSITQEYSDVLIKDGKEDEAKAVLAKVATPTEPVTATSEPSVTAKEPANAK